MSIKLKALKYLTVGGISFVCEYGVFIVMVYVLSNPAWVAQIESYLVALFINFILLKNWAFNHKSRSSVGSELPKYLILVAINLPITTALMHGFTLLQVEPFIAKIIVIGFAAIWNFLLYDKVVFKEPKTK